MTPAGNQIVQKLNSGLARLEMHWRLFQIQRQIADQTAIDKDKPPVIFFNASTRLRGLSQNAAFSLLSSWAVQLAGAPVLYYACHSGMSHCVLGTVEGGPLDPPPCQGCIADTRRFTQTAPTVWFDYREDKGLREITQGKTIQGLKGLNYRGRPLGQLVLPSLRWALRRHHLPQDEGTRTLFRSYLLSANSIAEDFKGLIDRYQPPAVVVFNGLQYPEAVVRWVGESHGVRVITHEVGFRPLSAFFTEGEATNYPIDIPEDFELSEGQNKQLDDYLRGRFQGDFTMAGIQFWPEMRGLGGDIERLLDQFDRIVPVFTNVVFDTSQAFANTVFEHMFDWLGTVQRLIREHPETLFILRAHPDEMRPGKESRQSVADWVKAHQLEKMDNVLFFGPDEPLSSYELIKKSKFVMVYNSSIGLEASLLGIPVLCGGQARFTQYPIVYFPETRDRFLAVAEDFLQADRVDIPDRFVENARRFLYYQLYKVSLPFDEFLEESPHGGYVKLKDFPIARLKQDHSRVMRTVVEGILGQDEFVMGR